MTNYRWTIFSIVYAICMLFAGRFVDWMGTKKGFLWAIGVWSAGACLHAVCGIVTEAQVGLHSAAELAGATGDVVVTIATVSMYCFLAARCILALGEAGNFPAAIKVTAEYFPKKDRAYATSIFNAGASIGALIAPLTIPILAKMFGWEMAFIVIGGLGFIWMGFWVFMYDAPSKSKHVNQAELDYIEQDNREAGSAPMTDEKDEKRMKFWQCFSYKQTWAFVFGKFMTDGVWWFFLFWTPSYLNTTVRYCFSMVPGYLNRYWWSCSSILVGQYILYRRRYVPKNSYCKYHRYRWYGRRRRLYDSSESGR